MSLEEQIKKILLEHPEFIIKALESKIDILYSVILKLAPWDKLATKEDLKLIIDLINKRFEDVNKRFEDINRRFDDVNKRFEDVNKRFEDMKYYIDRRIGFLEKLIVSFDIPILIGLILALIKLFV